MQLGLGLLIGQVVAGIEKGAVVELAGLRVRQHGRGEMMIEIHGELKIVDSRWNLFGTSNGRSNLKAR